MPDQRVPGDPLLNGPAAVRSCQWARPLSLGCPDPGRYGWHGLAAGACCRGVVEKVEEIPEDLSVGQVVWAPPTPAPAPGPGPSAAALPREQSSLVFVGWSSTGSNFPTARQLGFKYCSNRPCAIFAVAAPGAAK